MEGRPDFGGRWPSGEAGGKKTLNLVALSGEDENTKLRKYENCVRHRREESTNVESTKVRKLPIGA